MYGKLFDSMFDGTLYGHWEAIVTLQQMVILCTPDGIVDMTPQTISARTSIPLDIITKGLQVLAEPDPYSRTPGEEGRRIVLMDAHRPWGWVLVNHEKYQHMQDADTVRAQTRERVRKHRETQGNSLKRSVTDGNAPKRHSDSDSDSTTDSNKEKSKSTARKRATPLPKDFEISQRVTTWAAEKGFASLDRYLEFFTSKAKAKGYTYADWDQALMNCIREDWPELRKGAPDYSHLTKEPQ